MAPKKIIEISVIGKDKKGVIATFTSILFDCGVNIEDLEQTVREDFFLMRIQGEVSGLSISLSGLEDLLVAAGKKLDMEVNLNTRRSSGVKRIALLVTKEAHAPEAIISEIKAGRIQAEVAVMVGNREDLRYIAEREGIPFFCFNSRIKEENEKNIIDLLRQSEYSVDLIVLARYMQILSPEFTFRYESQIINIHPSLLPAYPGARAYRQAYNNGATLAGATAHFVTMDLDRGPIIYQEAFYIDKSCDTLQDVVRRGQELEQRILARAVRMFIDEELYMHWGKVYWRKSPYCDDVCPEVAHRPYIAESSAPK
ncbi:formyltetrahydrofolate deformylase [Desulfurispira natronophila]|uniref:Formyltetrahydrofolate deformylase n=1 Tax=Desulfurispira natronophila TaxID=682562 RepID=A0A7W7Y597_9BACT|nr:formyltetrahydrofolate deformylase [Desulfurispira natronophila]MBB5022279.1 formyltetrahydrofolate deformylase [Desulfurispira natronophila]